MVIRRGGFPATAVLAVVLGGGLAAGLGASVTTLADEETTDPGVSLLIEDPGVSVSLLTEDPGVSLLNPIAA
ncbi:hypothetical protein [Actinoplanes sp. NPDC051851]|uniref:hypothetical protein n=1 Tax=Actinoplanes sp. NPDC051851 TaxID=3154753 RepID=UPI00344AEA39